MAADNKRSLMLICDNFSAFLSKYILWHLLESPHRGDSNEMPLCIFYEISQILIRAQLFKASLA